MGGGVTRDLFKKIRDITGTRGSFNERCGAMEGSLGKAVTEAKVVKEIWQK